MDSSSNQEEVFVSGRKVNIAYRRETNILKFVADSTATQCLPMLRSKLEKSLDLKKLPGVDKVDLQSFGQGEVIVYADGTDRTKFDASTVRIATSVAMHLRDYGASIV